MPQREVHHGDALAWLGARETLTGASVVTSLPDASELPALEFAAWQRWFDRHQEPRLQPKRWLYFDYAYQMVQAAIAGQGVVLARMPLIAEALARGDLIEVLPGKRIDSPLSYWQITGPRAASRPEIVAFCAWLDTQAALTRQAIGEDAQAAAASTSTPAPRLPPDKTPRRG